MRKFIIVAGAMLGLLAPSIASAAPAKDTTVTTTTVGNGGTLNVSKGVATFGIPTNSAYGVIKAMPVNLKLKDIKTLGFKSLSSAGGGMVYMNVITNAADGIGTHKVKYTPFAQESALGGFLPEPGIGAWYSHDMLTTGVRFNDADDNTPAQTWADAVTAYGDETVNRVSITAGASLGHGTVQIDRMQVNNSVISFN
jgi:hypothetical protein